MCKCSVVLGRFKQGVTHSIGTGRESSTKLASFILLLLRPPSLRFNVAKILGGNWVATDRVDTKSGSVRIVWLLLALPMRLELSYSNTESIVSVEFDLLLLSLMLMTGRFDSFFRMLLNICALRRDDDEVRVTSLVPSMGTVAADEYEDAEGVGEGLCFIITHAVGTNFPHVIVGESCCCKFGVV